MKQLILDYTPYCTRVALIENGELIEFSVEMTGVRGIVGNVYKGKVENVLNGMKAAFVNIGLERNGFLYVGDSLVDKSRLQSVMPIGSAHLSAGDVIMCQVVKDQFGQKGARLTTDITFAGNYLVFLPSSEFIGVSRKIEDDKRREYLEQLVKSVCPIGSGFIIRSAAENASDADIIKDAGQLVALWDKVLADYARAPEKSVVFEEGTLFERALRDSIYEDVEKIIVNEAFIADALKGMAESAKIEVYSGERNIMSHYGISAQINQLCERKVSMSNGAYIVIDKTEACTVIDVNTGKFVGTNDLEDTVFKTNMAAAECIAKQLRLRNISGIVIIDFIDMASEAHRNAVVEELKRALKHDRLKTTTVGMTPLGLVELTRKKTRLPIDDFMLQPCKECGSGFVISDAQLAFMLRNELVDFMIAHRCNTAYVGVCRSLYDMVLQSGILGRHIETAWADKRIYLYVDDEISRDRFAINETAPLERPEVIVCITKARE
ncbi:MAG: Rne/Rng family ribonuclease [Bacteroides sp.]|nr:Rne/Rng family ribonuclease [Bacillota bacterium]MCM1393582.1 Rne/Rng family ribonuclease [[Eubacterium] siraeum]MCM1454999.1 Rne/Rng family ribonuclease [Bacteroides sp.]